MAELLAEVPAVVDVAVQGEVARRDAAAALESPRRQVVASHAGAVDVLPVHVADGVAAPGELRGLAREVDAPLELREPGGLTVADAGGDIRGVGRRSRALESRELELDRDRLSGVEIAVEEDPREPPAHHAGRAVAEREGDVRHRHRHLGEEGRPVLSEPHGGASVREVGVGEPDPLARLLVAERGRIPTAEEVHLERRLRRPPLQHLRATEIETQPSVPDVPVGEQRVGRGLVRG